MHLKNLAETLSSGDQQDLLRLATDSIERGLKGTQLEVDLAACSRALRGPGASFVTINVRDQLRGCIGSLEIKRALAVDVVKNARAAAFDDPRFGALTQVEFENLHIHISVLSSPEIIDCASEDELLRQLRPGIDGVILEDGTSRATYLPSVWEVLPDPHNFLQQLKCKAGLSLDHWSETMKVQRYTTECMSYRVSSKKCR
ncbi:MAG: AmmeMemoRadiSam system protein A [Gammaproteobacteria bacterium]|jgi:AmmeMemoRadiSam system protein A|nr:AmmeMemoRadiSam system protein A [Gammaproteobacteria bacterium]